MSEDLMTYEEVAEHLGIEPVSVRSTMRRYGIAEQRGYPRAQVMALERKPRGRRPKESTVNAIDYASDAPDFAAWAGAGPNVTRIYESGDKDAMTDLRSKYNLTIAQWVANDVEPADAMSEIDVENLAREVVITYRESCRVCGITVEWTTAAWEPREAEAPLDGSGDIVCDAHA